MIVKKLTNIKEDKAAEEYILAKELERFSNKEYTFIMQEQIREKSKVLLQTLEERDDLLLICQEAEKIIGYALLTEHWNAWTERLEGFVYALALERQAFDATRLRQFLETLAAWGKERGYCTLRLEIPERETSQYISHWLHQSGWRTSGLITCKLLPQSTGERTDTEECVEEICLQPTDEASFPFVIQMLTEASWEGLSIEEQTHITPERFRRNIQEEFWSAFKEGTWLSFVAKTDQGVLCAHATAIKGYSHPVLALPEAELVDVSVLSQFQGRHLGTRLTSRILAACREHQVRLVRGSVVVENTPAERIQQVCADLVRTGWWLDTRILYMHLA